MSRITVPAPVLVPALVLSLAMTACGSPATDPTPSLTPGPSVSVTTEPDPIETAVGAPDEIGANIVDAMNSGNTAALEGYLATTVHVTYCASEAEGDVSDPVLVIDNVTRFASPLTTWDFDLPAATLDDYANNPGHYPSYADDFPAGALVGRSADRRVISFVVTGEQITRIFFCIDEGALTFA